MISGRAGYRVEQKIYLETAINTNVDLSIDKAAVIFDEFKRMTGITVF
jgi:hypothetical protein